MEVEDSVAARQFLLVDGNNEPALVIGMLDSGAGPGIGLLSPDGRQRLVIATTKDGPSVQMKDSDGAIRMIVGLLDGVLPTIRLERPGDAQSMSVALTDVGPTITLTRDDVTRISLVVTEAGPHILLRDSTGATRVEVANTTSAGSVVRVLDPDGKTIWASPTGL